MINEKELAEKQRVEARIQHLRTKFSACMTERDDGVFISENRNFGGIMMSYIFDFSDRDHYFDAVKKTTEFAEKVLRFDSWYVYMTTSFMIRKKQLESLIEFLANSNFDLRPISTSDNKFNPSFCSSWAEVAAKSATIKTEKPFTIKPLIIEETAEQEINITVMPEEPLVPMLKMQQQSSSAATATAASTAAAAAPAAKK